jgi:hypothetical protein
MDGIFQIRVTTVYRSACPSQVLGSDAIPRDWLQTLRDKVVQHWTMHRMVFEEIKFRVQFDTDPAILFTTVEDMRELLRPFAMREFDESQ